MSSQAPRRQASGSGRSGGGRALMLFGVLLALLSGVLVIYIVSQATSNASATVQLVVANQLIPKNTLMSPATIKADFSIENFPSSLIPAGAYVYAGQDALNVHLNGLVNLYPLSQGDVLLASDSRFVSSTAPGQSLVNLDPKDLKAGMVLFSFSYSYASSSTSSFLNPGDVVDILALECNKPFSQNGECVEATTLQNVTVYATFSSTVVLLLKNSDAESLAILAQSGTVNLALVNPANETTIAKGKLTPEEVASNFGYCSPPNC
jgi:Flp pilus assembly protein CpaB